jgi:hypothetical protein
MDAGASQPCAFNASENQKPSMVHGVHVRRSSGVTSQSMLVLCPVSMCAGRCLAHVGGGTHQVSSSPKVDFGFGITHPEGLVFALAPSLIEVTR